ncbi:MAG TPA: hypothetical protein PL110_12060 [Candidatus Eremiobacteraeota bacterium]|nr:MAG: hypothetical protein BWY64_00793 [bacterium ADurb.Bin363]HPZ08844.1 hypothetical protein [Candidatus Eremiobacteraeota bacterium]
MKTENFSEENECINKFFDDEFLVKILRKKDPETVRRIIEEILIIRFIKKKESQFINKILDELEEEELVNIFLDNIRKNKRLKRKIKAELKK